jgi:TatD DNase family protein
LDRLLIETDSPYLAPVPFRDRKRNEPAFVVETARVLADLKRVSLERLAEVTTGNFFSLFPGT